jgi:hypothetical protein
MLIKEIASSFAIYYPDMVCYCLKYDEIVVPLLPLFLPLD